jgi:hypothetical protein
VVRIVTNRTETNVVDEYLDYIFSNSKTDGMYLDLITFIVNNVDFVM